MAEYIDRDLIEWYGCNFEEPSCKNRECSGCSHAECSHTQVMQIPTADVIEIPKGATNGDMIKAMFPNVEIYTDVINEIVDVEICEDSSELRCSVDWWDAPYRRG